MVHNHRHRRRLVPVVLCALLIAPAVEATVVLPADLSELVRASRAIVHGRVVAMTATWADGRRRIDTLVTVEVEAYLKGDLGETVTIRVPGGQIGRYRSVMIGAPTFHEGDEVVLFLNTQGAAIPYVLGLSQGVFRVVTDASTSDRLVIPPPLVTGADVQPIRRGDPARRPQPIDRFSDQVRRLVAGDLP